MPTHILSVTRGPSGVWRIRTEDRECYATSNPWLASLADQYRASRALVEMDWTSGWHYRTCHGITPVTQEKSA